MTHGHGHWRYALLPLSSDDFIISTSCCFCCIIQRKEFFREQSQRAFTLDQMKAEDRSVELLADDMFSFSFFLNILTFPKALLKFCILNKCCNLWKTDDSCSWTFASGNAQNDGMVMRKLLIILMRLLLHFIYNGGFGRKWISGLRKTWIQNNWIVLNWKSCDCKGWQSQVIVSCDEKNNTSLLISWNSKRHVGARKMVVQLNGGLFIFFKMKGLY